MQLNASQATLTLAETFTISRGSANEAEVVQVMTYLVENETAALVVPARFLGRIHPYFQEVVQLLAVQVADEARHVEVFTRRARLRGVPLGVSGAGGRASLQTLLDEPDFALASSVVLAFALADVGLVLVPLPRLADPPRGFTGSDTFGESTGDPDLRSAMGAS